MIRFVRSGLTDQLGRSNFVDSNGFCIGFKEFPDGTPILWTTHPYQGPEVDLNDTFPALDTFQRTMSLREFLDKSNYVFGYAGVHVHPQDDKTQVARIVMVPDNPDADDQPEFYLYAIVNKGDDVYFADFSMSMEDRIKLFGNADTIRRMLTMVRQDVGSILKHLNALDEVVRSMGSKIESR